MTERWLPVVGFEGRYEVSDFGRVRSLDRYLVKKSRWGMETVELKEGRILRPGRMPGGHVSVSLGKKSRCVHELVLRAFVGPPPKGFECRHLNGTPNDNCLDNLQWSTRRRNFQDRKWHDGTTATKLRPDDVREMRTMFGVFSTAEIAARFGVCQGTVRYVRSGRLHSDV